MIYIDVVCHHMIWQTNEEDGFWKEQYTIHQQHTTAHKCKNMIEKFVHRVQRYEKIDKHIKNECKNIQRFFTTKK